DTRATPTHVRPATASARATNHNITCPYGASARSAELAPQTYGRMTARPPWKSPQSAGTRRCRTATAMPSLLNVRQHMLHGLIAAVIVTALAAFALARVPYVPREPLAISREFVELIQAGDLTDAYRLTNHGAEVGRTLDAFEANIRHQLGVEAF